MIEKIRYQWLHGTMPLDYAFFLLGGFTVLLSLLPSLWGEMTYFGLGIMAAGLIVFCQYRLKRRDDT